MYSHMDDAIASCNPGIRSATHHFDSNTCLDMQRTGARMRLLMLPQSCFRQINVPLDAAQDFVVDDALVAELKNSPTFHPERFVRKMLVFGREQPARAVGIFIRFQLAEAVFVF